MHRFRLTVGAIALALLLVFASGCGGGEKTVTVEKPAAEAPPTEEDPSEPGEKPRKKKRRSTSGGSGGGSITVPDVQGKDHQLAQDTMQAAGLYSLVEEDCSGQGRALLFDRNWQVEKQTPAAGAKANEDTAITLCSTKVGE